MSLRSVLYCVNDGYLVGGNAVIPSNPSEMTIPGMSEVLGCNHIRCSGCREVVRVVQRDEASSSAIRKYECACDKHDTWWSYPLDFEDDEKVPRGPYTWRCAGHPRATLPLTLDGVVLGANCDWPTWVRDLLAQGAPAAARARADTYEDPVVWLRKVYLFLKYAVDGKACCDALSRAIADEFRAPAAPRLKASILWFAQEHPDAEGVESLLPMVEHEPSLLDEFVHVLCRRVGVRAMMGQSFARAELDYLVRHEARLSAREPEVAALIRDTLQIDEDLIAGPMRVGSADLERIASTRDVSEPSVRALSLALDRWFVFGEVPGNRLPTYLDRLVTMQGLSEAEVTFIVWWRSMMFLRSQFASNVSLNLGFVERTRKRGEVQSPLTRDDHSSMLWAERRWLDAAARQ